MDWRILGSTFLLIFLAELGDKTQLAALASAAGSRSTWSVFIGAAVALVCSTLLAVALGSAFAAYVPARAVHAAAGAMFLIFGTYWTARAISGKPLLATIRQVAPAPGYLTRFVLKAAADFEAASSVDYLDLAARTQDQSLRGLLLDLALEDRCHLAQVRDLRETHGTTRLPVSRPTPVTAIRPARLHVDDRDRAIVAGAVSHERAAAAFYHGLAQATALPQLRSAFERMAHEDANHADRLQAWLAEA